MTGPTAGEPVPILLIEDDPGDAALISEAFRQSPVPAELHLARHSEQAMRFLHQAGECTHAPRPALILLDLHLPGRPGLDLLAGIKADPRLLAIPVVVLTSSDRKDDIQRACARHANAYITKPPDFDGYTAVIGQIATCFAGLIQLPP
jgi:CheY-like chemotaxis protein